MDIFLTNAENIDTAADLQLGNEGRNLNSDVSGKAALSESAAGDNDGKILTSTLWNQSGTVYVKIDGHQTPLEGYTYNQYCPDTSSSDTTKTLTGCTNTADSQIIYYWLENHYSLNLKVSTSDYFYLKTGNSTTSSPANSAISFAGEVEKDYDEDPDYTKYYLSDTANVGEGTLTQLNTSLSADPVGNGDFIAALNFYCGVKNHSGYAKDETGTYWSYGCHTDGTNAEVFKAAGFDSYYFVTDYDGGAAGDIYFDKSGLTDVAYSVIRENLDYGEPIRVGIPGHAIYMDGYRSDGSEYEYHLNYGWGVESTQSGWYTPSELDKLEITYLIIDLSPDIMVSVTSADGGYEGGSFLRGLERVNHIQNDKSVTFGFDDAVAGQVIEMSVTAPITSKVDMSFENINAAVITTAISLLSSARGMTFDFKDGAMAVNASSAQHVINETGNNAVKVVLDNSYLYSGYYSGGAAALNDLLNTAGYSYGEYDSSFYSSVSGIAVKSGSADDIVTLGNGSGIYGGLSLGSGKNELNIENGSLFCGSFTGAADTLTVNLTLKSPDYNGPMIVIKDNSSFSAFGTATGRVLNVELTETAVVPQIYNLVYGASASEIKNYSVNLTAPGVSETLTYDNPQYGNYILAFNDDKLGLLYKPGTVKEDLVNIYYDSYLINSGPSISDVSIGSGMTLVALAGGTIEDITVKSGGNLNLEGGSSGSKVTVDAGGKANANSGSTINTVTVSGTLNVNGNASSSDIAVTSGGLVNLAAGGVLTKKLKIADGGSVVADGGAIIMDISKVDPAEESEAFVVNIGLVTGSPNFVVTIDKNQKEGHYLLATGAADLEYPITVKSPTRDLGSLTVNSTLWAGGFSCTLDATGSGELYLDIAHADQTIKIEHSGKVGFDNIFTETLMLKPEYSGRYNLYGNFGILNGSVTLYDGKKKIAEGSVKNGRTIFNKGKTVALDSAVQYSVVVKNSDKGKSASEFRYTLQGVSIYWKGTHDNDTPDGRPPIMVDAVPLDLSTDWVGFSDEVDYQKFILDNGASLSFTISANEKIKVTVYDQKMRSLQIATLNSSGLMKMITTKNKLYEAGVYYLKVESLMASKAGLGADYSVSVNNNSKIFTNGDNSDDSRATAKDLGTVSGTGMLVSDGWVGFGDAVDYMKIRLDTSAKLSFTLNADDAVKFQIMNSAGKVLQTTSLSKPDVKTKELLVTAGEYYLVMKSTNALKGGDAYYSIAVNDNSEFYPAGDNTNDSWKAASSLPAKPVGDTITGWVGYGDAADYIKLELDSAGQLSLDLDPVTADDYAAKAVKLSCLDANGKNVALTSFDYDTLQSRNVLDSGIYYLGVTCANVKKYNTSYSITTGLLA